MALGGTPHGARLGRMYAFPPRSGWGRGWAGGQQSPHKRRLAIGARKPTSRPQAPPGCLLSALSSKEKQQGRSRGPGVRRPEPQPLSLPSGPARWAGREAGPASHSSPPARPPSTLARSHFSPHGHSLMTPELVLRNRLFFPRW